MTYHFPFGQEVKILKQTDTTAKKVFVLGVYASAVHAKWSSPDGKVVVNALAVASEPYIFWRGEGADKVISEINIPKELGTLTPASNQFNGPSGKTLDEMIIKPLGYSRDDCWLCDLVPHSCVNSSQQKAVDEHYTPLVKKYGLPEHSVPSVPKSLTDERPEEIYRELAQSKATTVVLLGDKPIRWFLHFYDRKWRRLADFIRNRREYGQPIESRIGDLNVRLIPLAHPRQIAGLGISSREWHERHEKWMGRAQRVASSLTPSSPQPQSP